MDKQRIQYLHNKHLQDNLTKEELIEWRIILLTADSNPFLQSLMNNVWDEMRTEDKINLRDQRSEEIFLRIVDTPQKTRNVLSLWSKITVAASITLAVITGGYFYYNSPKQVDQVTAHQNDILPGKSGATLTLGNGKKIKLTNASNGKLAEEAGVVVSKASNGQLIYEIKGNQNAINKFNTLSTSRGETYQVLLPDGTKVWLNAASSITYPANFASLKERRVDLEGEAYFEVAKDKLHPFVVKSGNQTVEVLGTHFNINSYANEPLIKTTLIEGSIKINGKNGQQGILKPNQQAVFSTSQLRIENVDTEVAIAWKNNKFMFDSAPIQEVMKMVERWYNVEIIYEGDAPSDKFNGSVSRFENVSKVLQILQSTKKVHFKIEGRRIFVQK